MGCCKEVELQANNTTDSIFETGKYELASTSDVNGTFYPVYQFHKGSDTLMFTNTKDTRGRFWRVSCHLYTNEISDFLLLL